jgi:hypothetical protein
VPVFGEKFILPVLATVLTGIVFLNPMKWDWQSRIALFVGVTALAFLLSHQIHLRNEGIRTGAAPAPAEVTGQLPTAQTVAIEQNADDSACSNIVAGKDAKLDCSSEKESGSAKKHPKSP